MSEALGVVAFPSGKNGESYEIFAHLDQVEKWRKNHDIKIADVVGSFDVFVHTNTTGLPQRASRQMLENTFGTSNDEEVITKILQHGQIKHFNSSHLEKHHQTTRVAPSDRN